MNPYLIAAIPVALFVGYLRGVAAGRAAERRRVLSGIYAAFQHFSSPLIHLLNGWVREDVDEEELHAGFREYAAKKKAAELREPVTARAKGDRT